MSASDPRVLRVVTSPGKLVLVGEYAVLDGAGAIVAAVDRGVRCTVTEGAGIVVPGGDDRFVRAALAGAAPGWGVDARRYVFEDANPVDLPSKPGFGGSAAATVAACLACGRPPEDAFAVHAAVQGSGSGVDVYAAVHGGVRRFVGTGEAARATPTDLPCPPLLAVWSGSSASTGPRVLQYRAWAHANPAAHARFVAASRRIVDSFAEAPADAMTEAYAQLRSMAMQAGLAYDTPGLLRIAVLARAHGGVAKPSGAGGGDVAVALFVDPEARAAFAGACAREGLTPITVEVAWPRVEGGA